MHGSRTRRSLLAGLVVCAFVLTVSAGVGLRPTETAFGATSTLLILSGPVSVREAGGALVPASDGATLAAGSTIVTGAGARAVITYFEGSTVTVEPESELVIDALSSDGTSSVITMTQQLGRTWHVVTRLIGAGSRYEVRTPAATAAVRGTAFQVAVSADGATTVTTTEGAVATSATDGTGEVIVVPGTTTTVRPGAAPEPPRPAPRAERQTTVEIGAASGLVVDPLGRANGIIDGRIVLQTPGAQATVVDGRLVVSLPDLPDGRVSTVLTGTGSTEVITSVGRSDGSQTVAREIAAPEQRTVAVEIAAGPARPSAEPRTVPAPAPTLAPTAVPTVVPAVAPTAVPTIPVQTVIPTPAPTAVPTVVPTPLPTAAPIPVPTITVPTVAPTVAPTLAPTLAPTPLPTLAPTPLPTLAPTPTPAPTPPPTPLLQLPGL